MMTQTLTVPTSSSPLRALYARNPLLAVVALLHLALVPFEALLMSFDARQLDGASVWIKPIKFDVSIAVFVASMIFVLAPLAAAERLRYSRRIAVAMWIETVLIAMQAARGVPSHFNQSSPFDGIVFSVMGMAIVYNSYLVGRLLVRFARGGGEVGAVARRAIALGLFATLAGSIVGGLMAQAMSHLGRHGGDVRLAHAVGLHGLQVMLLLGAVLARTRLVERTQLGLLNGVAAAHLLATVAAFWVA